jgi:hypothetical protein
VLLVGAEAVMMERTTVGVRALFRVAAGWVVVGTACNADESIGLFFVGENLLCLDN